MVWNKNVHIVLWRLTTDNTILQNNHLRSCQFWLVLQCLQSNFLVYCRSVTRTRDVTRRCCSRSWRATGTSSSGSTPCRGCCTWPRSWTPSTSPATPSPSAPWTRPTWAAGSSPVPGWGSPSWMSTTMIRHLTRMRKQFILMKMSPRAVGCWECPLVIETLERMPTSATASRTSMRRKYPLTSIIWPEWSNLDVWSITRQTNVFTNCKYEQVIGELRTGDNRRWGWPSGSKTSMTTDLRWVPDLHFVPK